MTTLREAAEIAMEAMESNHWAVLGQAPRDDVMSYVDAIHTLRTALEAPPQRKPLTDEEIAGVMQQFDSVEPEHPFWVDVARAIEQAHGIGEKNG